MGLEFIDNGEEPTSVIGGDSKGFYGITTPPKLELVNISFARAQGGVRAHLKDFNYTVKSYITQRADYVQNGKRTVFDRQQKDIERTSRHEAEHRDKQHQEYNRIHDHVLKDLNNDQVYKDSKGALEALGKKLNDAFREFNYKDSHHLEPVWHNYKPTRELPPVASRVDKAAEDVSNAEHGLNPKPK